MIRHAGDADLEAILDLAEAKRAQYIEYQPRFHRPAQTARGAERPNVERLISDGTAIVLMADNGTVDGAIIVQTDPAPLIYDPDGFTTNMNDFMIRSPDLWPTPGRVLLSRERWHSAALPVAFQHDPRDVTQSGGQAVEAEISRLYRLVAVPGRVGGDGTCSVDDADHIGLVPVWVPAEEFSPGVDVYQGERTHVESGLLSDLPPCCFLQRLPGLQGTTREAPQPVIAASLQKHPSGRVHDQHVRPDQDEWPSPDEQSKLFHVPHARPAPGVISPISLQEIDSQTDARAATRGVDSWCVTLT